MTALALVTWDNVCLTKLDTSERSKGIGMNLGCGIYILVFSSGQLQYHFLHRSLFRSSLNLEPIRYVIFPLRLKPLSGEESRKSSIVILTTQSLEVSPLDQTCRRSQSEGRAKAMVTVLSLQDG